MSDSSDEAVTSMSSPCVARAAQSSSLSSSSDPVVLVAARPEHLQVGRTVYVRDQRAVIVEMDFPNVFWCFDGGERVKHRNYEIDRDLFQVVQGTEVVKDPAVSRSLFPANPSGRPAADGHDSDDADDEPEGDDAAVETVANGLMSMLSVRPRALEYVNEADAFVENAATNSRVHLLQCQRSSFQFFNRLAHAFLESCNDCVVEYPSCISSVEILKCFATRLHCGETCGTVTIESSSDIALSFPASSPSMLCVCTNVTGVRLLAQRNGETVGETVVEVHDDPAPAAAGEGAVEGAPAPVPLEHTQIRVLWDGATFHSSRIERDGQNGAGNIRNLNNL